MMSMMKLRSRVTLVWLVLYLVLMVLLTGWMQYARAQALATYSQPREQQAWQAWRERVADGKGPVARRIPKSSEPPALVLLRDFYVVCLAGILLFASAIFVALMFFVRGVLESTPPVIDLEPDSNRRD